MPGMSALNKKNGKTEIAPKGRLKENALGPWRLPDLIGIK